MSQSKTILSQRQMSNGVAKLVLTLLETLRQLVEKQARHRIEEDSLNSDEVEKLGIAFMNLDEKIREIARIFKIDQKELTLGVSAAGALADAGQLPRDQIISLADILDRVLETGVVVLGEVGISVADIELVNVSLRLAVSPVRKPKNKKKSPGRIKKNNFESEPSIIGPNHSSLGTRIRTATKVGRGRPPRSFATEDDFLNFSKYRYAQRKKKRRQLSEQ